MKHVYVKIRLKNGNSIEWCGYDRVCVDTKAGRLTLYLDGKPEHYSLQEGDKVEALRFA